VAEEAQGREKRAKARSPVKRGRNLVVIDLAEAAESVESVESVDRALEPSLEDASGV